MFLFSFGGSRNRDHGKLSAQPEDITGPQDDRSSSKSGPKGEIPGLESVCSCSPRQALSPPHTLGGAKDTWSRRKARSQPGRTRLGAAEFSGFHAGSGFLPAGHLAPQCPPVKRTAPLWGKAWVVLPGDGSHVPFGVRILQFSILNTKGLSLFVPRPSSQPSSPAPAPPVLLTAHLLRVASLRRLGALNIPPHLSVFKRLQT